LQVWDTVGQGCLESSESSSTSAVCNSDLVMIVYDVTDYDSFAVVADMVREVRATRETVPIIVVGNKTDALLREVLTEDGETLAATCDTYYAETSAKSGSGVLNLEDLVSEILCDPSFDAKSSRLPDVVLTLTAQAAGPEDMLVSGRSISGDVKAILRVKLEDELGCLHPMLREHIDLPKRRLKLVLSTGQLIQLSETERSVNCLLASHMDDTVAV